MVKQMGQHLAREAQGFDNVRFVELATAGFDGLELKQRSDQICAALRQTLPEKFRDACNLMLAALHPESDVDLSDTTMDELGIRGWAIMPMAEFVARRGLDDFDFSMDVLRELTKRFTGEFAVRAFIRHDSDRALKHAREWAGDANYHVRRLASEATRPRLPWGQRLPGFVADPTPVLPILEMLKDDPEEYVRRSVANSLNDIAKDHRETVAGIASEWLADANDERKRLVRHACRTLVKQGHGPTLRALGYGEAAVEIEEFVLEPDCLVIGGHLKLFLQLQSATDQPQPLIIDYIVHHVKSDGKTSPKVFKWKTLDLSPGEPLRISKRHGMKPVTTRTYYPGKHRIEILINGKSHGSRSFDLELQD